MNTHVSLCVCFRASLTDLYYWTGYLRIEPCSNAMVNSSCGTDVDESIPVYELGGIEKQCLANNYTHRYKLDLHNWRYCNELHPFICEKQLGIHFSLFLAQLILFSFYI